MMSGLRPGEYYVVAVDDMEQEDWRDPVVLDRLRSSGLRVTVSEGVNDRRSASPGVLCRSHDEAIDELQLPDIPTLGTASTWYFPFARKESRESSAEFGGLRWCRWRLSPGAKLHWSSRQTVRREPEPGSVRPALGWSHRELG